MRPRAVDVTPLKDYKLLHSRVARAEKNLSQKELAQLVGVSRQTISSIEKGQFNPTAKLALILCMALDKRFEELFYILTKEFMCPRARRSGDDRHPIGCQMAPRVAL